MDYYYQEIEDFSEIVFHIFLSSGEGSDLKDGIMKHGNKISEISSKYFKEKSEVEKDILVEFQKKLAKFMLDYTRKIEGGQSIQVTVEMLKKFYKENRIVH